MDKTQTPDQDEAVQAFRERGYQLYVWWRQRVEKVGSGSFLPPPMSLVAHRDQLGILIGRTQDELCLLTITQGWRLEVVVLPISPDPIHVIVDGVSATDPGHGGSVQSRLDTLIEMCLVPAVPGWNDLTPYDRLSLDLAGLLGCIDGDISFIFALKQWLRAYNSSTPRQRAVEVLRQIVAERWNEFNLYERVLSVAAARVLVPVDGILWLEGKLKMDALETEISAALEQLELHKLDKRHPMGEEVWRKVAAILKREASVHDR